MSRPTVADAMAEAKAANDGLKAHEDICAIRYAAIHETLGELKDGFKSHGRAAWVVAFALLGWLALQVWEGRNAEPPAPVVASATR